MAVCLNHTDTDAVTRCAACGKPLCAACIAVSDGADYCSQECCDRGKAAAGRSAGVISEKAASGKSRMIRTLIFIFIIIAVAAAGVMYCKNDKSAKRKAGNTFDSVLQQTKAVARKTGAAIQKESKAVKKTLDTDSKYKRSREGLVK